MLLCLDKYFSSRYRCLPILNPDAWHGKAKTAWIALEYGEILSFNQIELAIVYLLVALGAREIHSTTTANAISELPDAASWCKEYPKKAQKIIPNIRDVPVCLSITQYIILRSQLEIDSSLTDAIALGEMAIEKASNLGLQNLMDTSKYANLPGLNAAESHRTWICAYLWTAFLKCSTGGTVDKLDLPESSLVVHKEAFEEAGISGVLHSTLMEQIRLVVAIYKNPLTCAQTITTFESLGDKSLFLENRIGASDSEKSALTILYWYTKVMAFKPLLYSDTWQQALQQIRPAAVELVGNILVAPFFSSFWGVILEQCAVLLLFDMVFVSKSSDCDSRDLFEKCLIALSPSSSFTLRTARQQYLTSNIEVDRATFLDNLMKQPSAFSSSSSSTRTSVSTSPSPLSVLTPPPSLASPLLPHSSSFSYFGSATHTTSQSPYESLASVSRKRSYPSTALPSFSSTASAAGVLPYPAPSAPRPSLRASAWSISPRRRSTSPHSTPENSQSVSPCSSPCRQGSISLPPILSHPSTPLPQPSPPAALPALNRALSVSTRDTKMEVDFEDDIDRKVRGMALGREVSGGGGGSDDDSAPDVAVGEVKDVKADVGKLRVWNKVMKIFT